MQSIGGIVLTHLPLKTHLHSYSKAGTVHHGIEGVTELTENVQSCHQVPVTLVR